MREFTIGDKKFYLNGKPLYLKATFFEGLYPVKLAYPDSREMAIREIQLAKDAGFNMIRPWRKPPPPMWLDLADEMGVLTVGSLAVECMDLPIESARDKLPTRAQWGIKAEGMLLYPHAFLSWCESIRIVIFRELSRIWERQT